MCVDEHGHWSPAIRTEIVRDAFAGEKDLARPQHGSTGKFGRSNDAQVAMVFDEKGDSCGCCDLMQPR
jgi:hypothetical protein